MPFLAPGHSPEMVSTSCVLAQQPSWWQSGNEVVTIAAELFGICFFVGWLVGLFSSQKGELVGFPAQAYLGKH